jgi:integrase
MRCVGGTAAVDTEMCIIKDGGYATSLTYVEKLISVIERWNLTQYDAKDSSGEEIRWYRVRKSWADAKSQKGAYKILDNAKRCADNCYCKYYEAVYILFHTGMRISEFCGLTISDLDMENRIIDINHQLQRSSAMEYYIESTKTNAGTRKIPMTEEVYRCFQAIIEDREAPRFEKMVDGYTGFLYLDDQGMPLVAMHWEHRFNHMVNRYNEIYRVQMPNITPHVCRHTYCSNQARAGMNPKTLQYLMGHSDIGVTLNVYTHLGLEDAAAEMARMEAVETARKEQEKISGKRERENTVTQKMFRAF